MRLTLILFCLGLLPVIAGCKKVTPEPIANQQPTPNEFRPAPPQPTATADLTRTTQATLTKAPGPTTKSVLATVGANATKAEKKSDARVASQPTPEAKAPTEAKLPAVISRIPKEKPLPDTSELVPPNPSFDYISKRLADYEQRRFKPSQTSSADGETTQSPRKK